jgi:histidine triad (HIT) family protein
MSQKTLFERIIAKEIPADFVHEDELCVAIKDLYPKAPVHLLVIPRKPIPSIKELEKEDAELLAHLTFVAKDLAKQFKCEGYRLVYNVGKKGGQEIFHLHLHMMGWPE